MLTRMRRTSGTTVCRSLSAAMLILALAEGVASETNPGLAAARKDGEAEFNPWALEVLKLVEASVQCETILAYIDSTPGTFNLDAGQVARLSRAGVDSDVVRAMLQHDTLIGNGTLPLVASTVPEKAPATRSSALVRMTPAEPGSAAPVPQSPSRPAAPVPTMSTPPDPGAAEAESAELGEWEDASQAAQGAEFQVGAYRVREPYPVQLTSPIMVLRMSGRPVNRIVVWPLE